ncbi:hypothetical protein [Mycobacterium sp. 94-17]|uniref:DUF7802 domain-containing protein n=1 Tax=Mycobacterium sp. 94-17 TaxID=2986147 RepID=UPI002D1E9901|nr:hypothetical protein [Mycobacterium sp. 94-17]MEB4209725.1 hypothetical protein [Mycobacterium sp. 94-17]
MNTCTADFARLTAPLEGIRCDGNPFISFHNPFGLQNWTFPVIELLLVTGALACLVHALRWQRRQGDSSNVVVWCSLVLALLLVEPITYFPHWFGLDKQMGLVFVHGQFSVQFLYNRLPLYIVAMYPVFGYIAYVIVQRTGIFKKFNAFVSGTCVAFVFLALFEVIDTVGPQWRWWVWNTELPSSQPSLGVVPYASLQGFSLLMPFAIAFIARLLAKPARRRGWQLARDIVVVSLGVWPLMLLNNMLSLVFGIGTSPQTGRFIATWLLVVGAASVSAYAFVGTYRARKQDPSLVPDSAHGDYFAAVCVGIYLVFGVMFWVAALPDYLAAVDGVTPHGDPTGSLTFGVVNLAASALLTCGAYVGTLGNDTPATRSPASRATAGKSGRPAAKSGSHQDRRRAGADSV